MPAKTELIAGDELCLKETETSIGQVDLSHYSPPTRARNKEKYRKWRFQYLGDDEEKVDSGGMPLIKLRRMDINTGRIELYSRDLVTLAPEHRPNFNGKLLGTYMRAAYIKDIVDLAHVRGYAVMIERTTSADGPDELASYKLYQVDAESIKNFLHIKD